MQEDNEESDSVSPEEEVITAQYDNLMSQIPLQLTHEQEEATRSTELLKSSVALKADASIEESSNPESKPIEESSKPVVIEEAKVIAPGVGESVISGNRSDETNKAIRKFWEDEIKAVSLPYSTRRENLQNGEDGESCEGRNIFIYDLPSEFNTDLAARCDTLFPWLNLCDFFVDSGRGTPVNAVENGTQVFVPADRWFNTHQYALEMISHARILKYKCRTEDPEKADLFYIPYYGGLDVIRWHFQGNATNEKRDELATKLFRWLEMHESWRKNGGRDHVLVRSLSLSSKTFS